MEPEEDISLTEELNLPDVTEYVRQQLASMGVSIVDEQELHAYTKDFLQLLKDRSDEEQDSTVESSFESVSQENGIVHTPATTSAVFKTVLHEGRDETTDLPAMATPTYEVAQKRITNLDNSILEVSVTSSGSHRVKRKVLRKSNSLYFDESLASSGSEIQSPSVSESVQEEHRRHTYYHQRQPKSFIRPATTHPHNKRLRKTDPVQRYHEFREIWDTQKPPGEEPRHTLRWHIREQLLSQDTSIYEPHHHRVCKPSNYIVPTSKKRQSLRWEVRHQLAQQVQ